MRTGFLQLLLSISAVTAAGCGNSTTDQCKQSLCGCGNRGGTQTIRKPYLQCSMPDASDEASVDAASDATMDASSANDASDDAMVDSGPQCFSGCYQVCQNQSYGTGGGTMFLETCSDQPSEAGGVEAVCVYGPPPCGRRPEGLGAPPVIARSNDAADFLARAAHLEAASIVAFRTLAEDLAACSAPAPLAKRARQAARDERRHARAMSALARRRGGSVPRVRASARRSRALFDVALENAVEGCVREAYGALFAVWQSEHARDPQVQKAMRSIARDEAAHAELAYDVHAWARTTLTPDDRARLDRAVADAWDALEGEVAAAVPSADLTGEMGVPTPFDAVRLVRKLRAALDTA